MKFLACAGDLIFLMDRALLDLLNVACEEIPNCVCGYNENKARREDESGNILPFVFLYGNEH